MTTGHLATLVVVAVSGFVIPRYLGPESYGQYAAALAVLAILEVASSLGLQQVEMRYLAPRWHGGRRDEALTLGSSLWMVRLALSVIAGLAAVGWILRSPKLGLSVQTALVLGLLCLFRSAYQVTRSLYLPFGHVGKLAGLEFLRVCLALPVVIFSFATFGLTGVFSALLALTAFFAVICAVVLLRFVPLRPSRFRTSALRPYLRYSLSTFAGVLFTPIYAQFPIYAVATWGSRAEAGILAVTVQFYVLARGLFLAGRRSLMPIMAELEERGELERLGYWGGVVMRYSTASATIAVVVWALLGDYVARGLLTDGFAVVYPSVTVILLAVVFFCAGASCVGLLFTRGLAGTASISSAVYAGVTVIGLLWVLSRDSSGIALRMSWVYAVSAAIFWAFAYGALGRVGHLWLPLGRTLLLVLPVSAAWPAMFWQASLWPRLIAAAGFVLLYGAFALISGLLPGHEVRDIFRALRRSKESAPATKIP